MDIIIVGAGEIGRYLVTELSKEHHRISVIEQDTKLAQDLEQAVDAKVINGDGSKASTLIDANVERCKLFIALTNDNTVNLASCSMAKAMGVKEVICRVHPNLQREEWLFDYRGHYKIDHLFSSEKLSALELAKYIRNPEAITVEELAGGRIELQQLRISVKSEAVGKTLRELKSPDKTRVALVTRKGETFIPSADTMVNQGDMVTVFGDPKKLKDFSKKLIQTGREIKDLRIAIFGGGEYGFALAQMLESWGCKIRVFEKAEERCQFLSEELQNSTIIHADATMIEELQDEQIGEVDFFVATSTSDEDNVMSCLQAYQLGAKKCLSLIHRADYAKTISSMGRNLGIRAAVSPREATRKDIERFLTEDQFHVVKSYSGNEVIEITVKEDSKADGKKISEIEWPAECVLVGLMRKTNAWVPSSKDSIEAGDLVYAMVSMESRRKFVKLLKGSTLEAIFKVE